MELSNTSHELNVSYLQVLAILSFEKENHKSLKEINFVEKLENKNLFEMIFKHFEMLNDDKKKLNRQSLNNKK